MGLYLSSGYIDQERIISSADNFIFEIGPRGTGKSFGILNYILEHKIKFMLLRRTQTEADIISTEVTNPFKAIMLQDPDLQIHPQSVSKNLSAFTIPGETEDDPPQRIGYLAALSTFATIRGADLSDVDLIFYDEFIPEKHQRPIKDEYKALMNVYETVNRNRELQGRKPVKMICAANSNDIANPVFIGLEIVLPTIKTLLKPTGQVLCLIKPQFEAGKENVGKKGVVRDPKIHQMVLDNFVALVHGLGFKILGLTFSPVKGPEGNIEFLGHLSLDEVEGIQPDTAQVVADAHKTLS